MIGRYYERIGDHAVNIGERVMYMVTGWLPEHSGSARARLRGIGAEEPRPFDPIAEIEALGNASTSDDDDVAGGAAP
jgi:hypothetical protein